MNRTLTALCLPLRWPLQALLQAGEKLAEQHIAKGPAVPDLPRS